MLELVSPKQILELTEVHLAPGSELSSPLVFEAKRDWTE